MSSHITHKCAAEDCSNNGTQCCAGCKEVFYCGKACQSKSWKLHKGPCKEAVKVKEDAEKAKEAPPLSFSGVFCAAGCGLQRGNPGVPQFLRCDRCLGAFYCSRECQLKAWPEHKGPCKEATATRSLMGKTSIADTDKLIAQHKKDAEAGDANAQYNLAVCYEKGTGVAIDQREAFKWYTRAAEAGHTNAQAFLGSCYDFGGGVANGVAVDKCEAVKWYKRAAEAGNTIAQYNLGNMYKNGEGVAVNKSEAFKWYKLAAEKGDANAQCNLGACYMTGEGIDCNKQEAVKWFKLAAEQGDATSQHNVGTCYKHGVGVSVDKKEADKWYALAIKSGYVAKK
jgi:hypothetical protein